MARAAVAARRELTEAERHVDVAGITRLLNEQKDEFERAVEAEKRRVAEAMVDGGRPRLRVTERMRDALTRLRREGERHARAELESMGYELTEGRRFDAVPEIEDRLRPLLGALTIRLRRELVQAELGDLARDAILRALLRVPGARNAASQVVSGAFTLGLAATFESHAHLVDDPGDGSGGWQYSSVLDAATCDECGPLDGEVYPSWDEIQEVLPNGGPNPACYGGGRCRCRAVPQPGGAA